MPVKRYLIFAQGKKANSQMSDHHWGPVPAASITVSLAGLDVNEIESLARWFKRASTSDKMPDDATRAFFRLTGSQLGEVARDLRLRDNGAADELLGDLEMPADLAGLIGDVDDALGEDGA
jgi:hypothetical protein